MHTMRDVTIRERLAEGFPENEAAVVEWGSVRQAAQTLRTSRRVGVDTKTGGH